MKSPLRLLLIAMNVLAASFLIWFGVWLVYMEPPYLSYPNLPFPVVSKTVRPGDTVFIEVQRCNSSSIRRGYITGRSLVPVDTRELQVELVSVATTILPGCHKAISALSVVPGGTLPGRYYLDGVAEIAGTVRKHVVEWRSEPFEVVP